MTTTSDVTVGGQSSIKRRRNSVVNTQRNEAVKKREQDNEDDCHRAIITVYERQQQLLLKERKLIAEIVRTLNNTYKGNVSARAVQDRIKKGTAHDVPRKGRKSTIPEQILRPLSIAFLTCIQLKNAQMKGKANRPDIINRIKKCLKDFSKTKIFGTQHTHIFNLVGLSNTIQRKKETKN